jgi:ribose 5-phosphate isomerase A
MASIDSVRIVLMQSVSMSVSTGWATVATGFDPRPTSPASAGGVCHGPDGRRVSLRLHAVAGESPTDTEKRVAAEAAAELVDDGMAVGLGTGSTVAFLLPALASRGLQLDCVATSPATERQARELGIEVGPFEGVERLDIAIDGADQVAPDGWLIKGGGGAHFREKIVAAAADRFVVIADSAKPVDELSPPVPLELAKFGLTATMRELGEVQRRDVPETPDGGVIVDYTGPIGDPGRLAARFAMTPGVVEHGLFPSWLVSDVLVGRGNAAEPLDLPE